MKNIFFVFILFSVSQSVAQVRYTISSGSNIMYTVFENKIFEGESVKIQHLKNTIRGATIFKDSSYNKIDIVFTVLNGKAYKSGIITPDSILFYMKQDTLFFRTKKGAFRNAGYYNPKDYGAGMLVFFQDMEIIAFYMAVNRFK